MSVFDVPTSAPIPAPQVRDDRIDEYRRYTKAEILRLLHESIPTAIQALRDAMRDGDHQEAVRAAQIVLDRAGYGPKSTVVVEDLPDDLSNVPREQLAERAERIARALKQSVH